MNVNDYPEKLINEEQTILNAMIQKMDHVLHNLDIKMQHYVSEAKDARIAIDPDLYLSQLLAQKGIKDTAEDRKCFLRARDELYRYRLLLHYERDGKEGLKEVKVGLHSCVDGATEFVVSWAMPICRHYLLENTSVEFESIVEGRFGEKYHTNYKLVAKNDVTLRFTHVVKAMNLFPGLFDEKTIQMVRDSGFFNMEYLDEMVRLCNPERYDPDIATQIISDEFLQELLERRSSPEFKNIVFSIQKKQGEIIQAPYQRHMIVQGCAGSGKSMIMLHRLPILLYDNPTSLARKNLYIITPSQMYIQLADNMRHQLEITDINMGTLRQYYDYCINRYPGHRAGEYGQINYASKISSKNEQYIYSTDCIADIKKCIEGLIDGTDISLEKEREILKLKTNRQKKATTYGQIIVNRLSSVQDVLSANSKILSSYFKSINDILNTLHTLDATMKSRKDDVLREIAKEISKYTGEIQKAQRELLSLDSKENATAIKNRNKIVESARQKILNLTQEKRNVEADNDYFAALTVLCEKIEPILEDFSLLKTFFSQNSIEDIYTVINRAKQLVDVYSALSYEIPKLEDKYSLYLDPISNSLVQVGRCVSALQNIKTQYLDYNSYVNIRRIQDILIRANSDGVKMAYEFVMSRIGVNRLKNGNMRAVMCSPYVYLQSLYTFHGAPPGETDSLLAVDEAQGVAKEELRLMKNVNGSGVVFNLYGDINQHIEGTKGIVSWDEYKEIIDYDGYELQENYRNASQITEYCNKQFDMKMHAINTPGKGVHEMHDEEEFRDEMITQLMDTQRAGLGAILVADDVEARFLLGEFSAYAQRFHDMTNTDASIHRTRWNILRIDDAKGLEFSSVIAISGRMSRNQQYIAYTRALDDLYVYLGTLNLSKYEKKPRQKKDTPDKKPRTANGLALDDGTYTQTQKAKHSIVMSTKDHSNSAVRMFFEERGLEVIDRRDESGRLWVIGEKSVIKNIIDEAISMFGITGKYASSNESRNMPGWYTKTRK